MKVRLEAVLGAGAVLVAALFLLGVLDVRFGGPGKTGGRSDAGFHAASPAPPGPGNPACQAEGCHDAFPHRADRGRPAFLNMHLRYAECLACHGKEARARWSTTGRGGEGKGRVGYTAAGPGTEAHAGMGPPVACRSCHSEEGRLALAAKGMSALPSGFADPLALRMIEGGARSWTPADLR